ncbi:MAG TPA: hypothetical protein VG167_04040 [Verrucomicrobiae bacterium]|nr:hypothetical protein [Verrucomicrobiae bacterium]
MLTTLPTLKSRLSIPAADPTNDALLTSAIKSLSARFDKETNRTLARTETATFEFNPTDTELAPPCYPIESITKWETKTSEATGWQEIIPAPAYLIRHSCIISLYPPFSPQPSAPSLSRVTYTGGYVLPGTDPAPGQAPLPDDLEQACVEQVAYWFQNRDHLGLKTYWPSGAAYYQFAAFDLLDSVKNVLSHHTRILL